MSDTKVITGLVRFSYVHVFEPHAAQEGSKEKYSVSILIPKSSTDMISRIEDAVNAAADAGKAKFNNKDPRKNKNFKWPLRDGDEERSEDGNYAGMMFLNASSNTKPGLIDVDKDPILDPEDFYSGCWGRASINFYPFNTSGNMGVACGLNNLQKLKDDEALAGKTSAKDDFADEFADEFEEDDLLG